MATPAQRRGASPAARGRINQQQVQQLAAMLSQRDRTVVESVAKYGFITSKQVEILHFDGHASPDAAARICRRVLARLHRHRLLEPLDRRIGGLRAGSASYVWRLGLAGDRVLRLNDPEAPRARRKEPSLRFLQHRLAVVTAVCHLTLAARAGIFELLRVDNEPASWRRFGDHEILKPDLFAVTAAGDYEDHWFIELDLGTESLPTVLRQCAQYERYRRSGHEQAASGLFPRVLWLVPDDHRCRRLAAAIERRPDLDAALFGVHLHNDLVAAVAANAKGGEHEPQPRGKR